MKVEVMRTYERTQLGVTQSMSTTGRERLDAVMGSCLSQRHTASL